MGEEIVILLLYASFPICIEDETNIPATFPQG